MMDGFSFFLSSSHYFISMYIIIVRTLIISWVRRTRCVLRASNTPQASKCIVYSLQSTRYVRSELFPCFMLLFHAIHGIHETWNRYGNLDKLLFHFYSRMPKLGAPSHLIRMETNVGHFTKKLFIDLKLMNQSVYS